MRIDEELKKTGFFWLPENSEKQIPGLLTINNGGRIELEIVGHFGDGYSEIDKNDVFPRIIGHVEKIGLVTLDNCFYINKNVSFGGISKSKILVNKVLCGAAWDKDEPLTFNSFSFSVDCLDEWVGISGINVVNEWDKKTATITYDPPENISLLLNNGMKFEICFAYTLPGYPHLKEAKITQRAYFRIESEKALDLNEFSEIAYKITNFVCFATDEIVSIKNVTATSNEIYSIMDGGKKFFEPIHIYYQSIPFTEKKPEKQFHEMIFNFGAIKDNAQLVFNNWLNAYEFLSPALGLYFSTKFGAQKYIDGKFLALAQGLETYHRRTSSETLMEPEYFNSLIETIKKGCPEKHIEWLEGRLMHGNEINLRKRIRKIIEPFKVHFGSSDKRERLLRKIVDTRNYLTHYSESLKENSATGRELWVLCQKIEAIFNLHFLNVIGFTEEEINMVVQNCYPLKQKLNEI